jgi:hypothetical protein
MQQPLTTSSRSAAHLARDAQHLSSVRTRTRPKQTERHGMIVEWR